MVTDRELPKSECLLWAPRPPLSGTRYQRNNERRWQDGDDLRFEIFYQRLCSYDRFSI